MRCAPLSSDFPVRAQGTLSKTVRSVLRSRALGGWCCKAQVRHGEEILGWKGCAARKVTLMVKQWLWPQRPLAHWSWNRFPGSPNGGGGGGKTLSLRDVARFVSQCRGHNFSSSFNSGHESFTVLGQRERPGGKTQGCTTSSYSLPAGGAASGQDAMHWGMGHLGLPGQTAGD